MTTVSQQIAVSHFGKRGVKALARKGVTVIGLQAIPDNSSPMPFANASTGYVVNDNDCGRVLTLAEVNAIIKGA